MAQSGRIADSIPHFRAAVIEKPGFAVAHYNLGTARLRTGDREGAIEEYRQALVFNPGYEKRVRGWKDYQSRRWEAFRRAANKDPLSSGDGGAKWLIPNRQDLLGLAELVLERSL